MAVNTHLPSDSAVDLGPDQSQFIGPTGLDHGDAASFSSSTTSLDRISEDASASNLPDDQDEQNRIACHRRLYEVLGRKLHLSPPRKGGRVLDLGTGAGDWAIDYAKVRPEAEVVGTDHMPIQPQKAALDLEADIYFPLQQAHLDSFKDLQKLCGQAYRTLVPGGYFEVQEIDESDDIADRYETLMEQAGFVDITKWTRTLPTIFRPARRNSEWSQHMRDGISCGPESCCKDAREMSREIASDLKLIVVYGRKHVSPVDLGSGPVCVPRQPDETVLLALVWMELFRPLRLTGSASAARNSDGHFVIRVVLHALVRQIEMLGL
ncbi:hypothetical protein NKR23_g12131 [Pleurostoma richardsiae]|uniref:Methyltransferase domain-containing protein n=1 Tax=Pleurostoma richardsiae TaxID=41990 RepID=A0AA38R6H7_9PEZI|nr:hypothetical protein NKR23_g12131 [Pleurostoma richardsiae]